MHPIFQLEGAASALLEHDFRDVAYRSEHTPEPYRGEAVLQSMRMLYLDVMNAHAALFEHEEATQRAADIMSRFIRMLEGGSYRQHRTVAYYAQELCVTPKHLHKVSTEVSGRSPSYWIQQFTVMEIHHLLKHKRLTAKEVAGMMNFDNVSHFNRYVSAHLGVTPKNIKSFRNKQRPNPRFLPCWCYLIIIVSLKGRNIGNRLRNMGLGGYVLF